MAAVSLGIPQQVILVLGFRFPEVGGRSHFGHRLAWPQARGVDVGDRVFRSVLLLVAGVEDRRAIAGADVVTLAIARARVVDLEEELEDLAIADAGRVKDDLDGVRAGRSRR
jgi:hypothetical protein